MKNVRICISQIIAPVIFTTIAMINCLQTNGQVTIESNTPTGGAYVGWSGAQNLEFRTNNNTYMQLLQNGNALINGSLINTSGYLGLHTQNPWSMFHIQGPNNTPWGGGGFREWMITGVFSMENSDNLFVGMKDENFNRSDAVWPN